MNRPPDPRPARAELIPFDPRRHALEERIELAKDRLFADLNEAQKQLRRVATSTARGVLRGAVLAGALMLGFVAAIVLIRRRKQGLRIRLR